VTMVLESCLLSVEDDASVCISLDAGFSSSCGVMAAGADGVADGESVDEGDVCDLGE